MPREVPLLPQKPKSAPDLAGDQLAASDSHPLVSCATSLPSRLRQHIEQDAHRHCVQGGGHYLRQGIGADNQRVIAAIALLRPQHRLDLSSLRMRDSLHYDES